MQLQHVQKMEAIATMAAGVAHNFRNTLTEIRVNSQLIQMNYQDESRPNQGTTFKIHLPAASPEGPKQDTAPPAVVRGNGQCVLVVDDEPEILTAMEGLLDYLGYRPEFASSGKEGLEKYMQRKPEAVLMNINMPEMDGVACIEEIINYDPAANIAIISGYEEDGIDGLSAEVRNLIKEFRAKPLGLGDLSELLAAMFKER
jgi:CheY-like chemotaxis protein